MVNPISSASSSPASEAVKAAAAKPQPQPTSSAPSDKVTLKSTGGDVDHDGDSH